MHIFFFSASYFSFSTHDKLVMWNFNGSIYDHFPWTLEEEASFMCLINGDDERAQQI